MARRPTQRQLFAELTAKFGPEVAEAFRASVADLKAGVQFQRLVAAIQRGDLQDAMDALHIDRAAFSVLDEKLNEAYISSGRGAVATMPAKASISFRFEPGNQRAASWIRRHAADLITGLTDNERNSARSFIAEGMATGASPKAVALNLVGRLDRTGKRTGGLIGLSDPQRRYVIDARSELRSTDKKTLEHYLTRGRRDRTYDRYVRAAIRDGKKIDPKIAAEMTRAYSSRLLKLRGEIIARTEGLPAIRAAKREAFQQLVDTGEVDAQDIVRTWHTVTDGRQRDTHGEMNSQSVRGMDAPYVSPSGAQFLYPGDTSLGAGAAEVIACRCDDSIQIKPTA